MKLAVAIQKFDIIVEINKAEAPSADGESRFCGRQALVPPASIFVVETRVGVTSLAALDATQRVNWQRSGPCSPGPTISSSDPTLRPASGLHFSDFNALYRVSSTYHTSRDFFLAALKALI